MKKFNKQFWVVSILFLLGLLSFATISYSGVNEDLLNAVLNGETEKAKELINKGADVNARTDGAGLQASGEVKVDSGNISISGELGSGETVLGRAIRNTPDVVTLLLDKGADVNAKEGNGSTPLFEAAMSTEKGNIDIMKLLLDKGADVNAKDKEGGSILNYVTDMEVIKLLLDKGADVNNKVSDGKTILMTAAMKGNAEFVKLLLDKGVDVNAKDNDGGTAVLWGLAWSGDTEVVKLLLDKGADVNSKAPQGETLLMMAIANPLGRMAGMFMKMAESMDSMDSKNSKTDDSDKAAKKAAEKAAMMEKVLKHQIELVTLLLDKGADVNAKSSDGTTALTLATKQGATEVINLLKKAGAKE